MEDSRVNASHITASSEYGDKRLAKYARLNSPDNSAWCASHNDSVDEWLQIDLLSIRAVTGVVLQGRSQGNPDGEWVTEFKVSYSLDGVSYRYLLDAETTIDKVRVITKV